MFIILACILHALAPHQGLHLQFPHTKPLPASAKAAFLATHVLPMWNTCVLPDFIWSLDYRLCTSCIIFSFSISWAICRGITLAMYYCRCWEDSTEQSKPRCLHSPISVEVFPNGNLFSLIFVSLALAMGNRIEQVPNKY